MKKIIALMIVVLAVALTGCSEVEKMTSDKTRYAKILREG